jgi:hypothetical protein
MGFGNEQLIYFRHRCVTHLYFFLFIELFKNALNIAFLTAAGIFGL